MNQTIWISFLLAFCLVNCSNPSSTKGKEPMKKEVEKPAFQFCKGGTAALPMVVDQEFFYVQLEKACSLDREDWENSGFQDLEPFDGHFVYYRFGKVMDGYEFIFRDYPEEAKGWIAHVDEKGKLIDAREVYYEHSEGMLLKTFILQTEKLAKVSIQSDFSGDSTYVLKLVAF